VGVDFVREARAAGVRDEAVLAALRAIPRALFVPDGSSGTGVDAPVPLPCGQTTSQPSLIALMVEAVAPGPEDRVLEIGTGYGYEAAVLGAVAREVWSVEWWPDLAAQARRNLAAASAGHVHVVVGDGRRGLPEHAPYDAIVVAARCDAVPEDLAAQLRPGGRIVAPEGPEGRERCLVRRRAATGELTLVRDLGRVSFVPLLGDA
jgi:protein-L-isoaspartate(D-aspartate) O-methyltransferase